MAFIFNLILERFIELVTGPFKNPEMIWIALPLIFTLIIIELYFGRYKGDELTWNTALTNSLVLIFVSLNLMQQIFIEEGNLFKTAFSTWFYVALFVFALGILLFLADFFRWIPEGLAFIISAHLPVNITAYTAIVLVYNKIPLDLMTFLAWFLIILILGVFFFFVKLSIPDKSI